MQFAAVTTMLNLYVTILFLWHVMPYMQINASPTVTVEEGELMGGKSKTENDFEYYEFLGVPYAKPPVGPLRFQSPQPPESWNGVRDATKVDATNVAYQIDQLANMTKIIGSEDCLYLNIYTPKLPSDLSPLLPVMVYIHGGGFIFGSGIIKNGAGPDFLIEHDVIVVTMNYRLGIFGFLSLDISEARGNMGLKDQVLALKWIQRNIGNFGGDKNNVTVFGISAGSASIEYLIFCSQAKNLFQKAILQSGSTLNHWAVNYEIKDLAEKVAKELGFNGNDVMELYTFLVNQPPDDLLISSSKIVENDNSSRFFFGFVPTVEKNFGDNDYIINETPHKFLVEGILNNVTIIRGFCSREGYLTYLIKRSVYEYLKLTKDFVKILPYAIMNVNEWNSKFLEIYQNSETDDFVLDFYSDLDFVSGIWISNNLMSNKGIKTYMYEFSYDGGLNFFKKHFGLTKKGASHGDDSGYLLNNFAENARISEVDKLMKYRMVKMWTDFAKTGNPTPQKSNKIPIEWPKFKETSPVYLSIDKEMKIKDCYDSKKISIFEELLIEFGI